MNFSKDKLTSEKVLETINTKADNIDDLISKFEFTKLSQYLKKEYDKQHFGKVNFKLLNGNVLMIRQFCDGNIYYIKRYGETTFHLIEM